MAAGGWNEGVYGLVGAAVSGAATTLVYFGWHKREHKALNDKDTEIEKHVDAVETKHNTLEGAHNRQMLTCPVKEIAVEHKAVMEAMREFATSRLDLTRGSERFSRIEQELTATRGDIKDLQGKFDHLAETKLETISKQVNLIFGYLKGRTKGEFGSGGEGI